jgi:hypothetical protein
MRVERHPGLVEVVFKIEGVGEAKGVLKRFLSPKTVDAILRALPIHSRAAVWKEEVYFETAVKAGLEKPKSEVEAGDIAYWPLGSAVCVFYGKSQPYSPVNLIGKVTEGISLFRVVKEGNPIALERNR